MQRRRVAAQLAQALAGAALRPDGPLRYWMLVARFVLELLADQRFVPTLIQARGAGLSAAWRWPCVDPWAPNDANCWASS